MPDVSDDNEETDMSMTKQGPTIDWTPVSGVQPVVYVGRDHDRPLGIIEMRPATGFRVTACTGAVIGDFASLDEGELAFDSWLSHA
ncbi:MAG: hypothetical protein BGO97_05495 [Micrococcales bacterium 70-64]|nr:MAG: hypothetical protein ABT06_05500 [Leifsonia sp. SCN 70-46]OJX85231.1 MAG: hypothetical protein BGO97_05495 [Micrococcales bacterium 70-64]